MNRSDLEWELKEVIKKYIKSKDNEVTSFSQQTGDVIATLTVLIFNINYYGIKNI